MNTKICVVGAGYWGKNHIRTLSGLGCLGGIVETRAEILEVFCKDYPEARGFNNLEDALKEGFAGFTVATPASLHYSLGKRILEAGFHVLIEKPLTLDVPEAEELNHIARKNNCNLMVGHVLLFHPAFERIRDLLVSGKLGKLQHIYSNRLNLGKIRTEENAFWSLAPHDISLFQWMTGSFPTRITSRGMDILQNDIEDTSMTVLEYPGRIMGHIFVSWLHPFKEHRFVVIGSEGMVSFEDSAEGKPLIYFDKKVEWDHGLPVAKSGPSWHLEYEPSMPLTRELKYFIDHLDGTPLGKADGDSAVEVMKILEMSTIDMKNGKNHD